MKFPHHGNKVNPPLHSVLLPWGDFHRSDRPITEKTLSREQVGQRGACGAHGGQGDSNTECTETPLRGAHRPQRCGSCCPHVPPGGRFVITSLTLVSCSRIIFVLCICIYLIVHYIPMHPSPHKHRRRNHAQATLHNQVDKK